MTNEDLFFWLNGYIDLNNQILTITKREMRIMKNHLTLVKTVDGYLTEQNAELDELLTTLLVKENAIKDEHSMLVANWLINHVARTK